MRWHRRPSFTRLLRYVWRGIYWLAAFLNGNQSINHLINSLLIGYFRLYSHLIKWTTGLCARHYYGLPLRCEQIETLSSALQNQLWVCTRYSVQVQSLSNPLLYLPQYCLLKTIAIITSILLIASQKNFWMKIYGKRGMISKIKFCYTIMKLAGW